MPSSLRFVSAITLLPDGSLSIRSGTSPLKIASG
jgi:hypothetical protein